MTRFLNADSDLVGLGWSILTSSPGAADPTEKPAQLFLVLRLFLSFPVAYENTAQGRKKKNVFIWVVCCLLLLSLSKNNHLCVFKVFLKQRPR